MLVWTNVPVARSFLVVPSRVLWVLRWSDSETVRVSAVDRVKDRETYLRLAETLTGFLARMRSSAETPDIAERQRIVRLIVKEVLVEEDTVTIRHSIPISGPPGGGPDSSKPDNHRPEREGYLLRSGRHSGPQSELRFVVAITSLSCG